MFWFWEMLVYIAHRARRLLVRLEEGRLDWNKQGQGGEDLSMALQPAITDMEQLKDRPEVAALLCSNAAAVTGAKFDRNELTIWVDRIALRSACQELKSNPAAAIHLARRPHVRGLVSRGNRVLKSCTSSFPMPQ